MSLPKKKVLILTDFAKTASGFGRTCKSLMTYLYLTGKYDLINLAGMIVQGNPQLNETPWKSISTIEPQKLNYLKSINPPQAHGEIERLMSYGKFCIDEVVRKEKPDVVIAVQDIWGINFCQDYSWWDKITCALWTTLDSRPILPAAIEAAKKAKNFWNWNNFSTLEMHKLGLNHVKTVYGTIDCKPFYPFSIKDKIALRREYNVPLNDVIFGFVGRNQLRKGFPNLIEGFSIFKRENPEIKNVKLFFHTHFFEGWPIIKYCEKFNVPLTDILTTYVCRNCRQFEVKHFQGNDLNCKFCHAQKSQTTTSVGFGVTEEDLNKVYNFFDFYIHPMTSGGLEIPFAIESKLCGIPGAITNYSCGEDFCNVPESGTIPLDYDEYLEGTGTDFIKAWTKPSSIAKVMKRFYHMKKEDKIKMGQQARDFALKTFSVEKIGGFIENFIDSAPYAKEEYFASTNSKANPNFTPDFSIQSDDEFIKSLYFGFLGREPDTDGFKYWQQQLNN